MMKNFLRMRMHMYNLLKPFIAKQKKQVAILIAISCILAPLSLINPYFFKLLVDNVMLSKQIDMLKWVCIGYISTYILETIVLVLQRRFNNILSSRLSLYIRSKIWDKYFKMPFNIYDTFETGDLKNRIDKDVDSISSLMDQQIIQYVLSFLIIAIYSIILLIINWKLALFGFLIIPLSIIVLKPIMKGNERIWDKNRKIMGQYESWLFSSLREWKEIKSLTIEKSVKRNFARYWNKLGKLSYKTQMCWFAEWMFSYFKEIFINKFNMYFVGSILIFNGEVTIGTLLIFMKYFQTFFNEVERINQLNFQLSSIIPNIEKIVEVLKLDFNYSEKMQTHKFLEGRIKFDNVYFKYNDMQKNIFQNFCIDIKPNERIAVVGRSGSGKTTFLKLLLGLYSPQSGSITIDGNNINNINPAYLYENIGVVMQDSYVFNISIKDNLSLARPSASSEDIQKACKLACIHEFIESLPEGYLTLVGENGIKLSGGQKQRLAIARLLLKTSPNIFIFDEATSSLDSESEKMILKAIDNIAASRTVITIAHRLSSILSADRIIVIDNGMVAGDGHHSKLLGHNEVYDTLYKEQYNSVFLET